MMLQNATPLIFMNSFFKSFFLLKNKKLQVPLFNDVQMMLRMPDDNITQRARCNRVRKHITHLRALRVIHIPKQKRSVFANHEEFIEEVLDRTPRNIGVSSKKILIHTRKGSVRIAACNRKGTIRHYAFGVD